ncbi:MAG TPA: FAD-binding oxidoreductase [Galbitalea sp.]|jgi:glycine/D-amino acid oxidase-like deaminating enzyme|nr:FAD-binding oxidoreductase [Galbitalea sp.]
MDYRSLSFWHETVPDDLTPRAPLPGDVSADVAIVGGGLTGLWTAYYLLKADPKLRVVVLEKEIAGFGASGRNGGWCSALFPRSTASLEKQHGLEAALAMRRAMIATVDEVARVTTLENIDCDFVKGGTIAFARDPVQARAADAEVAEAAHYGVDPLQRRETSVFDPNCARVHPAKLVRGIARVVEKLGGAIYEQTEVTGWTSGAVRTTRGTATAATVVIALEGYGATLPQTHRRVLPLYSLMIATEPLDDATWDTIGIEHGQTFTDFRHLLIYGQRTADNRFAFGGRGARYHWGSTIRPRYDRDARVFGHLKRGLDALFPEAAGAAVTHSWGGPLGVPRDWHAGVSFDAGSRIATAGGYVGDGLSTTNIAGRTLADLIRGAETELTALPWVGHRSPDWEVEPLRFVGANLGMAAMETADVEERVTHRASLAAKLMGPLVGH